MKQVTITIGHRFFEDLDRRYIEENIPKGTPFNKLLELANEWYGYDIVVDDAGKSATIDMTDQGYTMWLLRWS